MKPMDGPDGRDASTTRTLSRGLALLAALLDAPTPPTLTELATQTGLAKATASRLLATLVDEGFAAQAPGGAGFLAGPSIARWLRTSPLEALLAEQAAPALRELRRLTGETAVLCTAAWPDRVCIAADRSEAPVRAQKSVGDVGPPPAAARGGHSWRSRRTTT